MQPFEDEKHIYETLRTVRKKMCGSTEKLSTQSSTALSMSDTHANSDCQSLPVHTMLPVTRGI